MLQAEHLQMATAEVEEKEKKLVSQCLEQFSEARGRLSEMREREDTLLTSNQTLQVHVHVYTVPVNTCTCIYSTRQLQGIRLV